MAEQCTDQQLHPLDEFARAAAPTVSLVSGVASSLDPNIIAANVETLCVVF